MAPPSINNYGQLLTQALKLFDGDETEAKAFLDMQISRVGADPAKLDWDWRQFETVAITLNEMTRATPRKRAPKKKEEKPVLDLLSDFAVTADGASTVEESTGEVVTQPPPPAEATKEEIIEGAREALGIDKKSRLTIETEDDLNYWLKRRLEVVAKIEKLEENFQRDIKPYRSELQSWTTLFETQCEAWAKMHPPKKGRTISTGVGQLSFRSVPESLALNTEYDRDGSLQQGWLHQRSEEEKKAFEIKPKTVLDRNLDKIKEHFAKKIHEFHEALAEWKTNNLQLENVPQPKFPELPKWLRYTPKHDSFSIKQ